MLGKEHALRSLLGSASQLPSEEHSCRFPRLCRHMCSNDGAFLYGRLFPTRSLCSRTIEDSRASQRSTWHIFCQRILQIALEEGCGLDRVKETVSPFIYSRMLLAFIFPRCFADRVSRLSP